MTLTVGVDEAGYGPKAGPLVVAAACARGPLRAGVRIADSKKVFSQARGVGTLEPAVLGFVPAPTFRELLAKLGARLPDAPWYRAPLPLPRAEPLPGLEAAYVRLVDPAEFNERTRGQNKSQFLFEATAGLVDRVRGAHEGPFAFLLGKHGSRRRYLGDVRRVLSPEAEAYGETAARSDYRIPGATLSFLRDAEDFHELVALASMIAKYVRECAMRLLNDYWAAQAPGLRRTAGYGLDGGRFLRDIEAARARLGVDPDSVRRRL